MIKRKILSIITKLVVIDKSPDCMHAKGAKALQ